MSIEVGIVENQVETLVRNQLTSVYSDFTSNEHSGGQTHTHKGHEICICSTPSAILFCGEEIVRIGGNFAVFYPAGVPHLQLNHPHSIYRRFYVQYPVNLPDFMPDIKSIDRFLYTTLSSAELALLQPTIDLLLLIDREPEGSDKELKQRHLIAFIILILLKRAEEQKGEPSNRLDKKEMLVYRICRTIHEHYFEELSLDSLAQSQFISRSTLNRLFQRTMEMSVTEYVNRVRCSYAAGFLKQGFSVRETADRCGFFDQSYFIKVFKRIHGVTPHQYRRGKDKESQKM